MLIYEKYRKCKQVKFFSRAKPLFRSKFTAVVMLTRTYEQTKRMVSAFKEGKRLRKKVKSSVK